jgi:hypothetical protein
MDKFLVQNKVDKSSYHLLEDQEIMVVIGHHAYIAQSNLAVPKYLFARSEGAML